MWGGTGDSRHFLHDGRADFGHHIEIVSDSEDAREFRGESGEGWDGLHALRTVLTTELGFAFSDRRASGGALISAPVAYRVRREGVSMRHWVRRSDGSRLAFQALGPRDAPVLLMLQGQANSHRWWDRIRADFAADWLTVTFDYRGTGATESLDERQRPTWSTALFADDAAAVIEATGRHNAAVYATSMGGRVAQELALRHPKSVTALVLACTSPGGWLAFERTEAIRRSLANSDVRIRSQVMTDLFYTGDWIRSYGGYDGVPTDLLGDTTMSAAARRGHLRVSDEHDAGDRLCAITSPTLRDARARRRHGPSAKCGRSRFTDPGSPPPALAGTPWVLRRVPRHREPIGGPIPSRASSRVRSAGVRSRVRCRGLRERPSLSLLRHQPRRAIPIVPRQPA